jgi:hypothetical protein
VKVPEAVITESIARRERIAGGGVVSMGPARGGGGGEASAGGVGAAGGGRVVARRRRRGDRAWERETVAAMDGVAGSPVRGVGAGSLIPSITAPAGQALTGADGQPARCANSLR